MTSPASSASRPPDASVAPGVLLTGCSSGIGLETAQALWRRGWVVWATARRPESVEKLREIGQALEADSRRGNAQAAAAASRWKPLALDVANPAQVEEVVRIVADSGISLRALVNNAGYGQFGALEDLSEEEFRRQWEVNVAGFWRMTRACLPLLRASGAGATIVNISSILGRITLPFGGPYCASKHAMESLCDAWRVELAPWGIRVVLVEPGPIATRFSENAVAAFGGLIRRDSPLYGDVYAMYLRDYHRAKRWGELPASAVAGVIVKAIYARRPRARYLVTLTARIAARLCPFIPDWLMDRAAQMYLRRRARRPGGKSE